MFIINDIKDLLRQLIRVNGVSGNSVHPTEDEIEEALLEILNRPLAGTGDMLKSVYDPQNIEADAFDRANQTGTQTAATISDFDTEVANNPTVAAKLDSVQQGFGVVVDNTDPNNPVLSVDRDAILYPEVSVRADLPVDGSAAIGDIYIVLNPTTSFGITTYPSGQYIRDTLNGNLNDWRKMNVRNKFADTLFAIFSSTNNSIQTFFNLTNLTTSRTLSVQDRSYTIADDADVQSNTTTITNHISDTLIHQPTLQFVEGGRNAANTTDQYLRTEDRVPMNLNGVRLNYDCTLISLLVTTNGNETWNAEIRKNDSAVPEYTEVVVGSDFIQSAPNIDFTAGDEVQYYCSGTGINRPKIIGVFQRR